MKKYKLKKDGNWVEVVQPPMTEEEKNILFFDNSDQELRDQIRKKMEDNSRIEINNSDLINKLNTIYNNIKPTDENFRFVNLNLSDFENGNYIGILDYLIKKERKRFKFEYKED